MGKRRKYQRLAFGSKTPRGFAVRANVISMRLHTFLFAGLLGVVARCALADGPDFNREVRPILSNYCFKCHGPDDKTRKAGLRFDAGESALAEAESGAKAIVPGQPEASETIVRIFSKDPDEVMPPPSMKKELSAEQRDILRRWIAAGAGYRPHWSFVKPERPAVPEGATSQTGHCNPIDAFVRVRVEREKLTPAAEADREVLVRRVSLDLIGLPPTAEEVEAFANDAAPGAYERLVERLLAAPEYGERWARQWLDLARYADTNGYEKDRPRSIWPYRDWVIRALNADQPFDRFTIEQIAGDLLPDASPEQIAATGFHRNTMLNEEGGIDPLEFRYHAMTDRVATTGKTWLGLTTGCAQCHTHKYDPIQHREYFSMFALLNNADEPEFELPDPAAAERGKRNAARVATLLGDLADQWPVENAGATSDLEPAPRAVAEAQFNEWLARERARTVAWQAIRPTELRANLPHLVVQPDASILASGDISKSDQYELKFSGVPQRITALRLEALPHESLPARGPGLAYYEGPRGDFFLGELQVLADGQPVKFGKATESYGKNNFGKNPASAAATIDGDPQTGWSCADRPGEAHEAVFVLAEPIAAEHLEVRLLFGRHYACSLGRFRISVTTDPRAAEARDLGDEVEQWLAIPDAQLSAALRGKLREHFLLRAPELKTARAGIDRLRKPQPVTTTLVLRERPPENPRPTFVHHRGEFTQPTERVEPGVFAFLNPLPEGAPRNRLAFARWLVSPENPLTARVTVNRAWAAFFGRGIVKTLDDFGYQGASPSHPELLDWLAVEFMEQGWSLKKLHRLIVTSATYRQASRATPELLARDRENVLLARGPRLRLEAEMIRDAALAISGLLTKKIGGPSVYPPQPEGAEEAAYGKFVWKASEGPDRYRRGLYTFTKRTAPYAMFNTFDGPSGEVCIAQREVSNNPLQALTALNDVVFLEAAQAIGRSMVAQVAPDETRLDQLFRRFFARRPQAGERTPLIAFLQTQRQRCADGQLDAQKLAGPGEGDVNERAAWTALARALFNLDEAVTKG